MSARAPEFRDYPAGPACRITVITGERAGEVGVHFYDFRGGRFIHPRTALTEGPVN